MFTSDCLVSMRDTESQYLSAMLNFTPFYFQDGQSNLFEEHCSIITELKVEIYGTNCSHIFVHIHTQVYLFIYFPRIFILNPTLVGSAHS